MKEKRYFCDLWDNSKKRSFLSFIMIVSANIIGIICGIINYNVILSKYGNEFDSYSESTYKYLDKIADDVIEEGVGIKLVDLPKDVVKYEIYNENNEIIFKYYLDNKDMKYVDSSYMSVLLSDNYEIISKSSNYRSEKEYKKNIKHQMIWESEIVGGVICIVLVSVCAIGFNIVAWISTSNKKKKLS